MAGNVLDDISASAVPIKGLTQDCPTFCVAGHFHMRKFIAGHKRFLT